MRRAGSGSARPRPPRRRGGCARTRSSSRPTSRPTARSRARSGSSCGERLPVVSAGRARRGLRRRHRRREAAARAARARRRGARPHRHHDLGRRRAEPADREGRLRPREAAGVRRDGPRGGVPAAGRRARCGSSPGSGPRRPSGSRRSGSRRSARSSGADEEQLAARFGARHGARPARPRPLPRLDVVEAESGPQSRAPTRRRSTATSPTSRELEAVLARLAARALRGGCSASEVARPHDRDQGPARRLDRPSRAPARCRRRQRHGDVGRRARAAARLRAAAAGPAARRARGGVRGGGRGRPRRPPRAQLALELRGRAATCREDRAVAVEAEPLGGGRRQVVLAAARRRGRGRSPARGPRGCRA